MGKINLTLTGLLAVLAFVFTLGVGPIHAQIMSYPMLPCPIKQRTVPPTKTEMQLPNENPTGESLSLTGTTQITDQTSSTVSLTEYDLEANSTHIFYSRTEKTLQHMTGSLAFDKGCTATDPYGSNDCTWNWGDSVIASYQGALQEDIAAGKFIVDLKVNGTPVSASGPVCGSTFTIFPPLNSELAQPPALQWYTMWHLLTRITQFWMPFHLVTPLVRNGFL